MRTMSIIALVFLAAILFYGNLHLPARGETDATIHTRVADYYIEHAYEDAHTPNYVTMVLADYRGYDTLGEAVVVFIAGVGVVAIMQRGLSRNE